MSATHLEDLNTIVARSGETPADDGSQFRWRALESLGVFRLFISVLLMALFLSSDSPRFFGENQPQLFLLVLIAWFASGVLGAIASARRTLPLAPQTELQLVIDTVAIGALSVASGGVASGIPGLLIIIIGAGSIILRGIRPVFYAALATLVVLGSQAYLWFQTQTSSVDFPAAGLLCSVIFGVALAIRPLSRRLEQSEALARKRGIDLANLAELNRYIVQHLRESIIVVDDQDMVRIINDAAAHYLGVDRSRVPGPLADIAPDVARIVDTWREGAEDEVRNMSLLPAEAGARLQVHLAPFGDKRSADAPLLIFLEDVSALAERVQQSKLASLGRLSASIAHEIRNPVHAMSHASQLLGERAGDDADATRLVGIIERNGRRVSEIVDSVLQLSRRDSSRQQKLVLGRWLTEFVAEYLETRELPEDAIRLVGEEAITEIRMDPGHLRQIMWNLCDNAIDYASPPDAGPVTVSWGRAESSRRPYLEIVDQGPGIDPAFADKIFEPFFTAEPGGTGLGLYICRELCELNRATLSYRPNEETGSAFTIVFDDPNRWAP